MTHLGGGGDDILLCEFVDTLDNLGARLSFRMAASAGSVLNCMEDCRRAPSLPVVDKEGRGAGFQRSPKAGSNVGVFVSWSFGGVGSGSQALSFLRKGEEGRNGDEGRNLGEEGILKKWCKNGSSVEIDGS